MAIKITPSSLEVIVFFQLLVTFKFKILRMYKYVYVYNIHTYMRTYIYIYIIYDIYVCFIQPPYPPPKLTGRCVPPSSTPGWYSAALVLWKRPTPASTATRSKLDLCLCCRGVYTPEI